MWSRATSAGFTLLEVLVSLVILSLALSTVIPATLISYRRTILAADKVRADLLAQSIVEDVLLTDILRAETRRREEDGFVWVVDIRPVSRVGQRGENTAKLVEVIVEVSNGASGDLISRLSTQSVVANQ